MTEEAVFLMDEANVIAIYGDILSSINTIWNIYVFVLLGMLGWIVVRAHQLALMQRILVTIVIMVLHAVIFFYFRDAYLDIGRIVVELRAIVDSKEGTAVDQGITYGLMSFDADKRWKSVGGFMFLFMGFMLALIWWKRIWQTAWWGEPSFDQH